MRFYFFRHFISGDKMTHIRFIGDLFRMVKFEVYKFRASPRFPPKPEIRTSSPEARVDFRISRGV